MFTSDNKYNLLHGWFMAVTVSKRDLLKSAVASAALLGMPVVGANASTSSIRQIFLFDSRFPLCQKVAGQAYRAGELCVDLVEEERAFWRNTRNGFNAPRGTPVAGISLWSDWLVIRGALEPLGWRVKSEGKIGSLTGAHQYKDVALFSWSMA